MATTTLLTSVCDSLAGYLLVIAITSSFKLLRKKLPSSIVKDKSIKIHPNLPDLQEFHVIECLLLYLISYPVLTMYRSYSGNLFGLLMLSIGLAGGLLFITGPLLVKYRQQDQDEKEKSRFVVHTGSNNNDSFIEVNEEEEYDKKDNTPTTANNNKQRGTAFEAPILGDTPPLPPPDTDPECDKTPVATGGGSGGGTKQQMVSFTRGVSKQRSSDIVSSRGTEDEDALSVVTWDPAFANMDDNAKNMSSSTAAHSSPFTNLIGGSSTSSHRRHLSEIVGGHNSISLESEMDGNLIDSNLEPHYSNLIDSANAPIFGVDSAGRVNVWNKCAMRIVGYTPGEVMGKVSLYISGLIREPLPSTVPHLIYSCLVVYLFPLSTSLFPIRSEPCQGIHHQGLSSLCRNGH